MEFKAQYEGSHPYPQGGGGHESQSNQGNISDQQTMPGGSNTRLINAGASIYKGGSNHQHQELGSSLLAPAPVAKENRPKHMLTLGMRRGSSNEEVSSATPNSPPNPLSHPIQKNNPPQFGNLQLHQNTKQDAEANPKKNNNQSDSGPLRKKLTNKSSIFNCIHNGAKNQKENVNIGEKKGRGKFGNGREIPDGTTAKIFNNSIPNSPKDYESFDDMEACNKGHNREGPSSDDRSADQNRKGVESYRRGESSQFSSIRAVRKGNARPFDDEISSRDDHHCETCSKHESIQERNDLKVQDVRAHNEEVNQSPLNSRGLTVRKTLLIFNIILLVVISLQFSCDVKLLRLSFVVQKSNMIQLFEAGIAGSTSNDTQQQAKVLNATTAAENYIIGEDYIQIGSQKIKLITIVALKGAVVLMQLAFTLISSAKSTSFKRIENLSLTWIILILACATHISSLFCVPSLTSLDSNRHITNVSLLINGKTTSTLVTEASQSGLQSKVSEGVESWFDNNATPAQIVQVELTMLCILNIFTLYVLYPVSFFLSIQKACQDSDRLRFVLYFCYLILKVYPLWQVYSFIQKFSYVSNVFTISSFARYLILELAHFHCVVYVTAYFSQLQTQSDQEVHSQIIEQYIEQKKSIAMVNNQKETEDLLEKLPEGILIVSENEDGAGGGGIVEFMNTELSSVLNLVGEQRIQGGDVSGNGAAGTHLWSGLTQKIFLKYTEGSDGSEMSANNEMPKRQQTEGKHIGEKLGKLNHPVGKEWCSLQDMIDDTDWNCDQDRYYEMILKLDNGQENNEEEEEEEAGQQGEDQRIFTQIRKLDVNYQEKPAKMLVIRNITFIIEYEKVKNENRYQELLTATMSHEMLTPLNSIINLSLYVEQKLRRKFNIREETFNSDGSRGATSNHENPDIKQSLGFLHIIKSSANILQFLVKDLIDLMNIRLNKFNTNSEPFSPIDACQEVLTCFRVQATEKHLYIRNRMVNDSRDKIAEINGDKQRFQQILLNIIQNGVKFTYVGGVEVVLDFKQLVDDATNSEGCADCGQLMTTVIDTGVGMDQNLLGRLFRIFGTVNSQAEQSMITTQGIGLGLTICRQLCEKLGGKISVNSTPMQGTDVTFSMPFQCGNCLKQQRKIHPSLSQMSRSNIVPVPIAQGYGTGFEDDAMSGAGPGPSRRASCHRSMIIGGLPSQAMIGGGNMPKKLDLKEKVNAMCLAMMTTAIKKQPFGGDIALFTHNTQININSHLQHSQTPKSKQTSRSGNKFNNVYGGAIMGGGSINPFAATSKESPRSEFYSNHFGRTAEIVHNFFKADQLQNAQSQEIRYSMSKNSSSNNNFRQHGIHNKRSELVQTQGKPLAQKKPSMSRFHMMNSTKKSGGAGPGQSINIGGGQEPRSSRESKVEEPGSEFFLSSQCYSVNDKVGIKSFAAKIKGGSKGRLHQQSDFLRAASPLPIASGQQREKKFMFIKKNSSMNQVIEDQERSSRIIKKQRSSFSRNSRNEGHSSRASICEETSFTSLAKEHSGKTQKYTGGDRPPVIHLKDMVAMKVQTNDLSLIGIKNDSKGKQRAQLDKKPYYSDDVDYDDSNSDKMNNEESNKSANKLKFKMISIGAFEQEAEYDGRIRDGSPDNREDGLEGSDNNMNYPGGAGLTLGYQNNNQGNKKSGNKAYYQVLKTGSDNDISKGSSRLDMNSMRRDIYGNQMHLEITDDIELQNSHAQRRRHQGTACFNVDMLKSGQTNRQSTQHQLGPVSPSGAGGEDYSFLSNIAQTHKMINGIEQPRQGGGNRRNSRKIKNKELTLALQDVNIEMDNNNQGMAAGPEVDLNPLVITLPSVKDFKGAGQEHLQFQPRPPYTNMHPFEVSRHDHLQHDNNDVYERRLKGDMDDQMEEIKCLPVGGGCYSQQIKKEVLEGANMFSNLRLPQGSRATQIECSPNFNFHHRDFHHAHEQQMHTYEQPLNDINGMYSYGQGQQRDRVYKNNKGSNVYAENRNFESLKEQKVKAKSRLNSMHHRHSEYGLTTFGFRENDQHLVDAMDNLDKFSSICPQGGITTNNDQAISSQMEGESSIALQKVRKVTTKSGKSKGTIEYESPGLNDCGARQSEYEKENSGQLQGLELNEIDAESIQECINDAQDLCIKANSVKPIPFVKDCNCESTVLIVDDNMFNIIPLELIINETFNIKTDKALNGQEAVTMFSRNLYKTCCNVRYKLILMDLNMPIMDGYEATTHILSLFQRKQQSLIIQPNFNSRLSLVSAGGNGTPQDKNGPSRVSKVYNPGELNQQIVSSYERVHIVAVTAFSNDENIRQCYRVGMSDVMHKPVNIDVLKRILDQYYHCKGNAGNRGDINDLYIPPQ